MILSKEKMVTSDRVWKHKPLAEMTVEEWEALCDGCGKCCLHKIEDIDSGQVYYTDVACRLLDLENCQCKDYHCRSEQVPDCLVLIEKSVQHLHWLPKTCAYRLLKEGKDLAWWHPLVSGDRNTVHQAGVSIRGRAIAEGCINLEDLSDRVVDEFD